MIKLNIIIKGIVVLLQIVLLFYIIFLLNNNKSELNVIHNFNDSLKIELKNNIKTIDSLNTKLDTLKINKNIINNKYETNIQNLNNPNVISDDSITRFISSQIYN